MSSYSTNQPQAQHEQGDGGHSMAVPVPSPVLPLIPIIMAILAFIIWSRMRASQQTRSERAFSHVRDTIKSGDLPGGPRNVLLSAVDHVESASGAVAHAAAGAASSISDQISDQSKRLRK